MIEETVNVARKVNELIREYVAIEEDVFKPSIRKSIPIPGFFKPVDYLSHIEELENMEHNLEEAKGIIRSLKPDNDSAEGQFLITLRAYSTAFMEAILELKSLCKRLYEKSKGGSYPRKQYESDARELRQTEMKYFDIGKKLNEQYKTILDVSETEEEKEEIED